MNVVKCCLGTLHCNWNFYASNISWEDLGYKDVSNCEHTIYGYMHCHLCITRDLYQRELYTQGKQKTSVRIQFFEKWNRYFLISYLFILISQFIKYTYSANVYSTCTTCTHTTSCTSIQQTTNLRLHARTVLSDLEITWCFEVEFFRSFKGFTINWCLLNCLQLIR